MMGNGNDDILIKNLTEAEKQQAAEPLGSVITADTISGGRLPWYPAAIECSLIGWRALVSQQPVLFNYTSGGFFNLYL